MAKNKADKICELELESEQVAVLLKVIHGKSRSQENRAPFSVVPTSIYYLRTLKTHEIRN